ncbi:MAG: hypothetical protein R3A47_07930 [Polyangiales bacterium]
MRGAAARIDTTGANALLDASDGFFCSRGVLGTDDVVESALVEGTDPEFGYAGDQLVVTSAIPDSRNEASDPSCGRFVDNLDRVEPVVLGFEILHAEEFALTLGQPTQQEFSLNDIVGCFGEHLDYEVRSRDAYTVSSTSLGFVHRVIATDNGCRVDTDRAIVADDLDTYLNGRAFPNQVYSNPRVTFLIEPFGDSVGNVDVSQLVFDINNPFQSWRFSTGSNLASQSTISSLPRRTLYEPLNDDLYVVDEALGLGIIDVEETLPSGKYSLYVR